MTQCVNQIDEQWRKQIYRRNSRYPFTFCFSHSPLWTRQFIGYSSRCVTWSIKHFFHLFASRRFFAIVVQCPLPFCSTVFFAETRIPFRKESCQRKVEYFPEMWSQRWNLNGPGGASAINLLTWNHYRHDRFEIPKKHTWKKHINCFAHDCARIMSIVRWMVEQFIGQNEYGHARAQHNAANTQWLPNRFLSVPNSCRSNRLTHRYQTNTHNNREIRPEWVIHKCGTGYPPLAYREKALFRKTMLNHIAGKMEMDRDANGNGIRLSPKVLLMCS